MCVQGRGDRLELARERAALICGQQAVAAAAGDRERDREP
jgi:hypothetical protein